MGYEYQASESIATGIRRIAAEKCTEIIDDLQRSDDFDEGIHEARKSFKQLRAALRFVRPALKKKTYKRENVTFRDASRLIAPMREKWVHIELLDQLLEQIADPRLTDATQLTRERLLAEHQATRQRVIEQSDLLAEVIDIVDEAQDRSADWQIEPDHIEAAAAGMTKIYAQGQTRMAQALDFSGLPDVAAFHEWRKSVKYIWYQLQLMHPTAPDVLDPTIADFKELSDLLGLIHDLDELYGIIRHWPEFQDGYARTLLAYMDQEQVRLENESAQLGAQLYSELPEAFEARLLLYWYQWQHQTA